MRNSRRGCRAVPACVDDRHLSRSQLIGWQVRRVVDARIDAENREHASQSFCPVAGAEGLPSGGDTANDELLVGRLIGHDRFLMTRGCGILACSTFYAFAVYAPSACGTANVASCRRENTRQIQSTIARMTVRSLEFGLQTISALGVWIIRRSEPARSTCG